MVPHSSLSTLIAGQTWRLFVPSLVILIVASSHKTIGILTEQQINGTMVCMSELESSACNPTGIDLALIIPLQDDRCNDRPLIDVTSSSNGSNDLRELKSAHHSSFKNLKQCPCRLNYSGTKCDTCDDGFYLKVHQNFSPPVSSPQRHHHHQQNLSSVNKVPRKQSRFLSCKPCSCDIIGSKSLICNKRNGACLCIEGHTGPKCDRCALGYFDATSISNKPTGSSDVNTPTTLTQHHCVVCGDCFNYWLSATMSMRNYSVEVVKRAHELAQSITSSMGLFHKRSNVMHSGEHSRLAGGLTSQGGDIFHGLDDKMSLIGERVLVNKQSSDRLNLLASELGSAVDLFNEIKSNSTTQTMISTQLNNDIKLLTQNLVVLTQVIIDLSENVKKYRQDQLDIQEKSPTGAHKFVQMYTNKSHRLLFDSLESNLKLRGELDSPMRLLESKVDALRESRRQLDEIASELINQSIRTNQQNISDPEGQLSRLPFNLTANHLELLRDTRDITLLLMEDMIPKLKLYLSQSDLRSAKLETAGKFVSSSRTQIDETDNAIDAFNSSVSRIQLKITSFCDNSEGSVSKPCNLSQVIENGIGLVRKGLNKIGATKATARSGMSELVRSNSSNNIPNKISHLIDQINKTLEAISPRLTEFINSIRTVENDDLGKIVSLRYKAYTLTDLVSAMNNGLSKAIKIRQDSEATMRQTEAINSNSSTQAAEISSTLLSLDGEFTSQMAAIQPAATKTNRGNLIVSLSEEVNLLRNRVASFQVKLAEKELRNKHLIKSQMNRLNYVRELNERLLERLKVEYEEALECLSSLSAWNQTAAVREDDDFRSANLSIGRVNRARLISEQRRLTNLVAGYRLVTKQLYKSLGKTVGLSESFASNERIFSHQSKLLERLHEEVDRVAADIKEKFDAPC